MFSEKTSSTNSDFDWSYSRRRHGNRASIYEFSASTFTSYSKPSKRCTDACSGIVNCVNLHDNFATIVGAPLATQNINVDGSQNIDQSNTCSDDDLGVPGAINCVNDAQTFGNDFAVVNLNGAGDVQVDKLRTSFNTSK